MRHSVFTLAAAASLLAACGSTADTVASQQARLRNSVPMTCTADQQKACTAPEIVACPDGQEPVLDFASDCCVHFSCQPVCQSAVACAKAPAPVCPQGTKLWIGTSVDDCCPAYRCEPVCASGNCACDAATAVCTQAKPYCGSGVDPVVVGKTADCCPIYQCPCGKPGDAGSTPNPSCGCTFPNCKSGETLVCRGESICGYPCTCEPAHGTCSSDSECPSDARCDLSKCLAKIDVPPVPALCDPAKCGAAPEIKTSLCADGKTMAGPSGRCLLGATGSCSWEIVACPPKDSCYGVCVPNVASGCKTNSDCPSGQMCTLECKAWGCSNTSGATKCACPASDPTCTCDSAGSCSGKSCVGQCAAPPTPVCDPSKLAACQKSIPACPDNQQPMMTGTIDPKTCCPIYQCPQCNLATTKPVTCPLASYCKCAKQTGTDPYTCCPIYQCGMVDYSTGKCL